MKLLVSGDAVTSSRNACQNLRTWGEDSFGTPAQFQLLISVDALKCRATLQPSESVHFYMNERMFGTFTTS